MTWGYRTLNDGRKLPEIGYGSWLIGAGQTVVDQVRSPPLRPLPLTSLYLHLYQPTTNAVIFDERQVGQAIEVGFNHIDSAQTYRNEAEWGTAIREAEVGREDLWVTTKWSGSDGKGIRQSLNESLENLGLKSIDLYLIHSPRLATSDPLGAWSEFELIKKEGFSRSIGVSNYKIHDLEVLRLGGLSTPSVNQILLHPYVYEKTLPLLQYHKDHGIVTEAYSTLIPLTHETGGPVDVPLKLIAAAHGVSEAQVLFAWARSKGAVIVTTTSKKERLVDYLAAGDLELTPEEIEIIDLAGAKYARWKWTRKVGPWVAAVAVMVGVKAACYQLW